MKVKATVLALLLCLFSTNASAQIVLLGSDEIGRQFYDHGSGKVFVFTEAGPRVVFDEVEATLANSGFRVATTVEAQSAFESIRISLTDNPSLSSSRFGVPVLFNGGGYVCPTKAGAIGSCVDALFDDRESGTDPSKVGLARFSVGQRPGGPLLRFVDIIPDEQDRGEERDFGAINQSVSVLLTKTAEEVCEEDFPAEHDFDCDGIDEKVVWRESTGVWFIRYTRTRSFTMHQWGLPGDTPLLGDYDGDSRPDLVVWRPSNGTWYVRRSTGGIASDNVVVQQFGLPGDRPIRADYDADGILDFAVWRPSNGIFYQMQSSNGQAGVEQWGLPGDIPITAGAAGR